MHYIRFTIFKISIFSTLSNGALIRANVYIVLNTLYVIDYTLRNQSVK